MNDNELKLKLDNLKKSYKTAKKSLKNLLDIIKELDNENHLDDAISKIGFDDIFELVTLTTKINNFYHGI